MVKPKSVQEIEKIKPPFFVKEADPWMSKIYYSEEELGYNKKGQAWVKSDLVWTSYLTLSGSGDSSMRGTPFESRHVRPVKENEWIFVAHPDDMTKGRLIVYTEQEIFHQAIKSIFEGAVVKPSK